MRPAVSEDLPQLKALWQAAFENDDTFSDAFFLRGGIRYGFVTVMDNKVVSMLFSLPVGYGERRLQYIYAAATLPDYRGRGLFGDLLRFAAEWARAEGCSGSFLCPADASLEAYYARFGYRPWTRCHRLSGTAVEGAARPLPVSEYIKRRSSYLPPFSLQWEEWMLSLGGEVAYETDGAIALCDIDGETLDIKEWFGKGDPAALCGAVGCTRYETVREAPDGEVRTLLLPFTEEDWLPPYVGPVMD